MRILLQAVWETWALFREDVRQAIMPATERQRALAAVSKMSPSAKRSFIDEAISHAAFTVLSWRFRNK